MKNYDFNKTYVFKGEWWIKKDKFLDGELEYIPNESIRLEVVNGYLEKHDPFFETIIDDGKNNITKIEPDNSQKTIYGYIKDDDILLTLINCFATDAHYNSQGENKVIYLSHIIIIGKHIENIDKLFFNNMQYRFIGLNSFLDFNKNVLCKNTIINNDFIKYKYTNENLEFEIIVTFNAIDRINEEYSNCNVDCVIKISLKENQQYNEYSKIASQIEGFFVFALNKAIPIKNISGTSIDTEVSILFLTQKYKNIKNKAPLMTIDDILKDNINLWMELYKSIPNNMKIFVSSIKNEYSEKLYLDNRFFNSVRNFEALHEYYAGDYYKYMNVEAEMKIKEIIRNLRSRKKNLVEFNFKFLPNEIVERIGINFVKWKLSDRLRNIFIIYKDILNTENMEEAISYIVNKRNGIAHAHSDLEYSGNDMYRYTKLLKRMNYIIISELTKTDKKIKEFISKL